MTLTATRPAPPEGATTIFVGTVVDTPAVDEESVPVLDESLPELLALARAREASERADTARDRAREQLRAAVIAAIAAGISEAEVARRSGLTRMTVRAWLGK